MTHTERQWLRGLVGAAINSGATAVTLLVIDPVDFSDWTRLLKAMAVMALVGAALYLKQHPLPPEDGA